MAHLPIPKKPYPDWARLLKAVWLHGMSVKNITDANVEAAVKEIGPLIFEAMTRRNEAQVVRPSAFLACARQTYFAVRGDESGGMPDNIGTTFAIGHTLHQLSYAAVRSALPPGFEAATEMAVRLPAWWPKDETKFNQSGTVDLFLRITDPELAAAYLPSTQPRKMLVDFKTMGGYSYKKHAKAIFGEDPDGFGYMSQLAVYADSPDIDVVGTGALVAGINRDSLTQPLLPRLVAPRVLATERARLQAALEMAVEGSDPGEEFLIRHDDEANFFCGRGGRPGYCAFRTTCANE